MEFNKTTTRSALNTYLNESSLQHHQPEIYFYLCQHNIRSVITSHQYHRLPTTYIAHSAQYSKQIIFKCIYLFISIDIMTVLKFFFDNKHAYSICAWHPVTLRLSLAVPLFQFHEMYPELRGFLCITFLCKLCAYASIPTFNVENVE